MPRRHRTRNTLVVLLATVALLAACGPGSVPLRPDEIQWWWSNQDPPEILALGPAGPIRAQATVQVSLRPPERASVVAASLDGREIPARLPIELDTTAMPDGPHRLLVVAEDRSRRRNRSEVSITIESDNTPPSLDWQMVPTQVTQGSAALLRLYTNEASTIEASSGDRPLVLTLGNGVAWTLLSFDPEAAVGPRSLSVRGRDSAGNESRLETTFTVGPTDFVFEDLQVPVALARLLAPEFRRDEETRLGAIYAVADSRPHWTGRFRAPVEGPIVTEFGTQRAYNGGPTVGHHAGVDYAVAAGVPVLAPQAGRVALVDDLTVRGRTLVLDHGRGVYSTYAHLQEVLVGPNAVVEAGQRVARVGTTGLSTGPHLHWEIWVGGANVDPIAWTKLDLPPST